MTPILLCSDLHLVTYRETKLLITDKNQLDEWSANQILVSSSKDIFVKDIKLHRKEGATYSLMAAYGGVISAEALAKVRSKFVFGEGDFMSLLIWNNDYSSKYVEVSFAVVKTSDFGTEAEDQGLTMSNPCPDQVPAWIKALFARGLSLSQSSIFKSGDSDFMVILRRFLTFTVSNGFHSNLAVDINRSSPTEPLESRIAMIADYDPAEDLVWLNGNAEVNS